MEKKLTWEERGHHESDTEYYGRKASTNNDVSVHGYPTANSYDVETDPLLPPDLVPNREVRITNERTGGEKGQKPERFDLIPYDALAKIAEIYHYGTHKYSDWNWRKGYDWSLSFGAAMRHLGAFWEGEDIDPESGLPHIAHAGFHIMALLTFMEEHPELDDRYKKGSQE